LDKIPKEMMDDEESEAEEANEINEVEDSEGAEILDEGGNIEE